MRHASVVALSFGFLVGTTTSVAYAQSARTWVSAVGDDLNPCSRALPCKTFAGAHGKTAAGGEISVVDPGSYGPVTITKSITIDGSGTLAGITAFGPGQTGIVVNAGNNDIVILRNLEINGAGTSATGVRFNSGKQLNIENTTIAGFRLSGVFVVPAPGAGILNVVISNSTISGIPDAVTNGVTAVSGNTMVSHSIITGNGGLGLFAQNSAVINADSNVLTFNGVAVQAGNGSGTGQSAATVRLSNNDVYNNRTGFGCGGGVLASAGNNRKGSNTGGTAPACSPTAVITQQ